MELPKNNRKKLTTVLIGTLIGLVLGLFFILADPQRMLSGIFAVLGVLTVIFNIPAFLVGLARLNTAYGKAKCFSSLVSIVVGCLMIFWHASLLMILLGIYMIASPILQILLLRDKKASFLSELPKIIIGVVLLLVGPAAALGAILDFVGWLILIVTATCTVASLIGTKKSDKHMPNTTGGRIFVDETGDGRVDTVYFDTTGDGQVDASVEFQDHKE